MEIDQVVAGYQLQTTANAGFSIQNYITASDTRPPGVVGSVGVGATYIDRPTVIYAPLTGNDFLRKLMSPIPPSAVLSLLHSGYAAGSVVPIAVDSINGVANGSRRQDTFRPADPEFLRLVDLLSELQRSNALQVEVERGKDGGGSSTVTFPSVRGMPDLAGRIAEMRRILRLSGHPPYAVRYGGYSGKGNEISIVTRSMLQIMLEVGTFADVPQSDIVGGKASPIGGSAGAAGDQGPPLLRIHGSTTAPGEAHVAVPYKGRWFWVADNDVRSKSTFAGVMLLFAILDVGVRPAPPVVTVPVN